MVLDTNNRVLYKVEDARQYQTYLNDSTTRTKLSKKAKKGKSKAKPLTPHTVDETDDDAHAAPPSPKSSAAETDGSKSVNSPSEFLAVDLNALVSLSPEDEYWVGIDETEVEVTDEVQVAKWKAAGDRKAAQDAGLTWKEKQLADFEGSKTPYKTKEFYSGWKAGYVGRRDKKRPLEGESSDSSHAHKRQK